MGRLDYESSQVLSAEAHSFDALIIAALRRADSGNAATLRAAFPAICTEAQARHDAPGGILADDPDAVDELARKADWAAFVTGAAEDGEARAARERARDWARSRLGLLHEPGDPEVTAYPGGKDGWVRMPCAHRECEYVAWEPTQSRAADRVRQHAAGKAAAAQAVTT